MKYNISFAKDISKLCNTCIAYIILFVTVLSSCQKSIPAPQWLLGIPLILICYQLIRNYCYHPVLYIFLHGIFWIPALLIPFPYIEYRYLFLVMLLFECCRAVYIWRTNTVSQTYKQAPWFLFTCVFLIYTHATSGNSDNFALLIYYLGLCVLLLHFIRFFITGLSGLIKKTEHATSLPMKKIMLTSLLIFLFFLIILTTLTVAIPYSNIDQTFSAIGEAFIRVIQLVIQFITYIVTILKALFSKDRRLEETAAAKEDVESAWRELQEPSLLSKIIEGILVIIVLSVFIYFVYHVIVWLLQTFTKRYTQDADTIVQLSKPRETIQETKEKTSVLKKVQDFFKNDNASKIRRGYRLRIKGYKPAIHQKQDTPTEIAQKIELIYNEDITELTQVYEKARYSNETITFEDVQKGGLL